jgi:glutaredoxin
MAPKASWKGVAIITALLIIIAMIIYNYYQPQNINETPQELRTDINVVLYSKKGCKYCDLAKKLLKKKRIPYEIVELTNNQDLIIKLVNQTGQNTVPYVFINDEFIGGYQSLAELDKNGKL